MTGKQLKKLLLESGWQLHRISGCHHIMIKEDRRSIPVPVHGNADLPKGLVHAILRQAGIKGQMMLSYAARIKKDTDGYLVTFPDFENVMTYGLTTEEALLNAEEALNGCLESDFERNFKLPEPSRIVGKNVYQIPVAPHIAVAIMLRTLRADRSQMEIARQLNIAYQVYQRLENPRKANPTVKTLEKIAKVFGRRVELGFV